MPASVVSRQECFMEEFHILSRTTSLGTIQTSRLLPQSNLPIKFRIEQNSQLTKQNIMQSYMKYKEYYDRKAKAAPLKENEYCFVLQPKADNQGSKIPFRDYRWVGPFTVQKVLPNENYIVRRINTNKTQILHRIRLKKFVLNQPLEDNFREQRIQPDDEIVIPQDDLYTTTWETD